MAYLKKRRAMRGFGAYPDDPTADMCTASPTMTGCPATTTIVVPGASSDPLATINADVSTGDGGPTIVLDDNSGLGVGATYLPGADPNWVTSSTGVCKPANSATLSAAKDFQRAVNRCLNKLSTTALAVDGAIGAGTMSALSTIANSTSAGAYQLGLSNVNWGGGCTVVVSQLAVLTQRLSDLADWLGAPSSVSSPSPASTPTYIDPITKQATTQDLAGSVGDFFQNMSTMEQAGVAALAVGIGYFAYTSFGKKKRK
jgi:hypothetical protein